MRSLWSLFAVSCLATLYISCGGDPKPDDSGDSGDSAGSIETAETGRALDCEEDLLPAIDWFDGEATESWTGDFEFGQTHVIAAEETRLAPPVIAERETLVLFTPTSAVAEKADVRLTAWQGDSPLGTLKMQAPTNLPAILEQGLTDVELTAYSDEAWSATLPWDWVNEDVELWVGVASASDLAVATHVFDDLGAPQRFTVTRSKILLFGDDTYDTSTVAASTVARDYFSSLPVAELRWVDTTDWILDGMVVATASGYQLVYSEDERTSVTTETSRWNLIKHQFALRMSSANTGRGLVLNDGWEGDSSPYSFGTSVVMGWVFDADGDASDIDDAGVAAGWTGWTAMWAYECDNTFIHELGHSTSMQHFTSGTAASWGISDEYPNDGQNMSSHPWGYDTARRMFRTWYQVTSDGPVAGSDEDKNGKYDPMNGGDSANDITCFPQYTSVYGAWIQSWSQYYPTFAVLEEGADTWQWDSNANRYEAYTVETEYQAVAEVDVPTVTLIGTIGGLHDDTRQTYPPIYSPSGNVFEFPDPEDADLDSEFSGAKWFLEITYGDGTSARALIAVGDVSTTDMKVYALNLASERDPVRADLYYSETAWPSIDASSATRVHSRDIEVPGLESLPNVLTAGRGEVANGGLTLTEPCTPDLDCDTRSAESAWRIAHGALTFQDRDGEVGETEDCLEPDGYSTLTVPILNEDGSTAELTVHGQRELRAGDTLVAVPLNDRTPWIDAADLTQAIRLWIPYKENVGLPTGTYSVDGEYILDARVDGEQLAEISLTINLTVYDLSEAAMSTAGYWVGPVSQKDSSLYFTVSDAAMGPTSGVWWDNHTHGPNTLAVPIQDDATGKSTLLNLDAYKVACDYWWDFNSAQAAHNGPCDNYAVLYVNGDNTHLDAGHSYSSPSSSPLIINAMRWHSPNPYTLIETFPLQVTYTAP